MNGGIEKPRKYVLQQNSREIYLGPIKTLIEF